MADAHSTEPPELWVVQLGTIGYRDALALQHAVRARRQADELPDVLLLLEHPPVYTRGRRSQDGDLAFAPEWYAAISPVSIVGR